MNAETQQKQKKTHFLCKFLFQIHNMIDRQIKLYTKVKIVFFFYFENKNVYLFTHKKICKVRCNLNHHSSLPPFSCQKHEKNLIDILET